MIYHNWNPYNKLLIVNRNLTLERFIEKTGAKSGFALNMFTHLYNSIFSECTYVEEEFEKYYKIEYESFDRFLHRRYGLSKSKAEEIIKIKESNPEYTIIAYDLLSYGMNDIDHFLFDGKLNVRINKILSEA